MEPDSRLHLVGVVGQVVYPFAHDVPEPVDAALTAGAEVLASADGSDQFGAQAHGPPVVHGDLPPGVFAAFVYNAVRWRIARRIQTERRSNPLAFRGLVQARDDDGEPRDPLDLVAGDEPEPGVALVVADECASLIDRAELTDKQRIALLAVVGHDQAAELAAERGVTVNAVFVSSRDPLAKVKRAAVSGWRLFRETSRRAVVKGRVNSSPKRARRTWFAILR